MTEMAVVENPNLTKNEVSFEQRRAELEKEIAAIEAQQKRDQRSPFHRWTQLNNEKTAELMDLALTSPKAHAILYFLVDQMDNHNAVVVSYQVMMEVLGVSKPTISKAIKTLKERGWIAVYKSGNANVYAINDSVFWKSWGNKKRYSKFPANVVLSESEQDFPAIEFERMKSIDLKN